MKSRKAKKIYLNAVWIDYYLKKSHLKVMFFTVSVRKNQSRLQNTAFLLVAIQTWSDFTHRLLNLLSKYIYIYIFFNFNRFRCSKFFLVGLKMDIKKRLNDENITTYHDFCVPYKCVVTSYAINLIFWSYLLLFIFILQV